MALTDRIIALADALGDGALRLRERLLNTASLEARFKCVERWLLARLKPRSIVHPAVRWAVDRIAASGGRIAIEDLATQTGFTRKHLGNLFQQQVGLSPKSLARIHRFRGALALLAIAATARCPGPSWPSNAATTTSRTSSTNSAASPAFRPSNSRAATAPTRAASYCDKWRRIGTGRFRRK